MTNKRLKKAAAIDGSTVPALILDGKDFGLSLSKLSNAAQKVVKQLHQSGFDAMVVGGGLGNLIDRTQTGAVVDFLDIHWRDLHWPAFNFADVFVVAAAGAWLLVSLRAHSPALSSEPKAPQ